MREQTRKNYRTLSSVGEMEIKDRMNHALNLISKAMRFLETKNFTFSEFDEEDMTQAALMSLTKNGFFESHGKIKEAWRVVMRAIESRDCMRLNCNWEIACEETVLQEIGVFHEYENPEKLDNKTIEIMKTCFATLRKAHEMDNSRKAKSSYKGNHDFLVECIRWTTCRSYGQKLNEATFRKRKQRFITYLASGAKALQSSNKQSANKALEREILTNLEKNLLAN